MGSPWVHRKSTDGIWSHGVWKSHVSIKLSLKYPKRNLKLFFSFKQSASGCFRSSVLHSGGAWIWKGMELFVEQIQICNGSHGENEHHGVIWVLKTVQLDRGKGRNCVHVIRQFHSNLFSSFQKFFNLIISNEIPFKFKTVALASTWRQKQNHDLILDLIIARHKEINSA